MSRDMPLTEQIVVRRLGTDTKFELLQIYERQRKM